MHLSECEENESVGVARKMIFAEKRVLVQSVFDLGKGRVIAKKSLHCKELIYITIKTPTTYISSSSILPTLPHPTFSSSPHSLRHAHFICSQALKSLSSVPFFILFSPNTKVVLRMVAGNQTANILLLTHFLPNLISTDITPIPYSSNIHSKFSLIRIMPLSNFGNRIPAYFGVYFLHSMWCTQSMEVLSTKCISQTMAILI